MELVLELLAAVINLSAGIGLVIPGRTQVRVPLRHREALMPDELLHASHRCALHRQVRAERVTRDVNAGRHLCPLGRIANT